MSSSVIAGFSISIGKIDKVQGGYGRNGFRVEDVFGPPDLHGIGTGAEALEAFLQASLLGFQNVQAEARHGPDQMQRDVTEAPYRVVDESLGAAEQPPVFATHRAPHQRAILGVELLHSAIGLDDLGTGDTDAALFGHGKRRATASNQSATAVAACPATNQTDNLHTRHPRLDERAHDLGDSQFAGIGFLQAHSAGVEQDQHRDRLDVASRTQKTSQFGAVNLAEGATHEAPLLSSNEYRRASNPAAPDDDAIVELRWKIEHPQMRTLFTLLRADELLEAAGVEHPSDPLACGCLVPAHGLAVCDARHILRLQFSSVHRSSSSIRRTACARRRATVSGRAPPSLMESFKPPGERRSTKSATTASHTAPKPSAAVLMSTWHSVSGNNRSTRTSRFPEATTPMMANDLEPAARSCALWR